MGLFDQFPYTNFHELNLDWILRALKELDHTIEQFVAINALKYADPIQWDITSQYEKNTIVIDPQTGSAYISVQAVPAGVALTNDDYWTIVFDLGTFVVRAAKNFTVRYEVDTTTTATFNTNAGDWLVWGDTLYIANVNITAGDSYVEGGNITHITMEEITGHLANLTTTDKNNLVSAINELVSGIAIINANIGDISTLTTTDISSIVNAINSLVTIIGDLSTLTTTDTSSIVSAINSLVTDIGNTITAINNNIGDLSTLNTTDKSSLVNAINEVDSNVDALQAAVGDLSLLNTSDKSSVVNALNEVLADITAYDSAEWINVKSYGAMGDNNTDDTAAINLAIAELITRGRGAIYFPPGIYKITGALTEISVSCSIFGAGKGASLIHSFITDGSNVFTFSVGVDNVSIHDIQFIGENNSTETWVYYKAGNYSTIYEVKLSNVYQFATISDGASGMIVFNIYRVYGWTRGRCILFNAHASGLVISNCNIDNSPQNAANFLDCKNDALYDTIAFYNNHIVGYKNVFVSITEAVTNSNVFIYNNIFDIIYERCVNIGIGTGGDFYRAYIEGNWLTSKTANPISIAGPSASQMPKQISICNNKFLEAYWSCATLAYVAGVVINGNQCTTFNNGNVGESAFSIQNSKHIIATGNLIVTQDVGGFGSPAPAFTIVNSDCVIVVANDAAYCAASVFTNNTNQVVDNNIGV